MADNFGLKIGLEGEKEFKKALADINQSFKVLGSEMKLVTSQFDKNDSSAEALAAKHKALGNQIEAQKQKIETLRAALKNASDSFGENDRRTQNWQIQLNNAEAALNDMERELKDTSEAADDMGEEVEDAGDSAEKSENKFSKLSGVLKTVGAAMGAVAVAAGAAAVKLGKEVIAAYADYAQLVGGVDTLFKDSSQQLQTYAANAYKTAGLSANDYMETVTGFSASLIQSLGGDTEKAVKYADMAITDMSDNANKMGTDMSSIQNAYQGFAKQNYTMLDNLKLGYGGTKQEMERLLADAEKISGVKYDISSYADVVEAIHVMQESMDIAGTTAKEAEATISGSMNALKSAVSNLIVGFGDANADMELLCGNMVDAFKTVVENITPIIENIIAALPTVLDALLTAVGELLPTLLESVTELFSQVLSTILSLLPQLIPAAVQALMTIVNTLIENLPLLIDAAVQLVTTLVAGIGNALPTLIPAAVQAIVTIVQGLVDSLPMILDAALQLITGLAQGLLDAIPVLIAALPEIINGIITFLLDSIPQIIETGIQLLTSLVAALPEIVMAIVEAIPKIIDGIITAVLNAIPQIIQAGIDLLISLIQALPQIITTIVQAIPQIISGIVNALVGNIDKIIMAGVQLFVALIENLPTIIVEIVKAVPQIIAGIVKAFGSLMYKIVEIGGNIVKGLWSGITQLASWLWDKVSGWISSIWDGICDFFGIHSPSKEMAWVGEMLVKGLSGSIEDNGDEAVKAAEGMAEDINGVMGDLAHDMQTALPTDFDVSGSFRSAVDGVTGKAASAFTIALNIATFNNYSNEDIRQLTNEVMETANQFAQRKGVVFA
nr:MAG TPA: tail tape measure protein [Caudoviricetes sp.]